jgi:hypothetical protein
MRRILVACIIGIVVCFLLFPAVALARFGIDPGKVFIDNLYPGAEADVPITIYNQNDYTATFLVSARQPDYTETGYEPFPYLDWISIEPEQVTIDAHENSEIMVVVIMPEDAQYSGKKAEFWISFKEQKEPGSGEMIQVEIASRLLISTRMEEETEPAKPETVTPQTAEEAEPTKPTEGAVQPTVEGGGEVGITAEPEEAETVPPQVEPDFPWMVVGPVLGVIVVVGILFILRWARQRST